MINHDYHQNSEYDLTPLGKDYHCGGFEDQISTPKFLDANSVKKEVTAS